MKVALLGKGKTGSKVIELNPGIVSFDSKTPPSLDKLTQFDTVISFLPGDAFLELLPMLIEANVDAVIGSTGFDWPEDLNQKLIKKKLKWIHGNNFSLGMNLVKTIIENISMASKLFDDYTFEISESHHTEKKDAPSGTALLWKNWLGEAAQISSVREGDIIGHHKLVLNTSMESISIEHEATDRALFAKGALWASVQLQKDQEISPGLTAFDKLVNKHLNI